MSKKAKVILPDLQSILTEVTEFYLSSSRFNGIPLAQVMQRAGLSERDGRRVVAQLIDAGLISVNLGDRHVNPHIKALPEEPRHVQLRKLRDADLDSTCLYPTTDHLETVVDPLAYQGRPFTLRLALGEPQMNHIAFDLSVLEFYRNDPRYILSHDDISGWISVHDRYCEPGSMPERDQVLLQSFGFAYDKCLNRAVAVFLWDLSGLSPEHQQIWNAKVLEGEYRLHPDYFRMQILGEFPERISIFDAFLEEMRVINEMSAAMGRAPLFRELIQPRGKPRDFCLLIRPTLKEYNGFVHLLDKLMSENINRAFFKRDLPLEHEETRRDGRPVIRPKGSIQLLWEWIDLHVRTEDRESINQVLETFREVRRFRQRPAHAIDEDEFAQEYFKRQRDLIIKAYAAMRLLRLLFANHPAVKGIDINEAVREGKIWTI